MLSELLSFMLFFLFLAASCSVVHSPVQVNRKLFVCVHKQKTRLARILAVKSGGANAYLQYKQSQLLIDLDDEVTRTRGRRRGGRVVLLFLSLHFILSFIFDSFSSLS